MTDFTSPTDSAPSQDAPPPGVPVVTPPVDAAATPPVEAAETLVPSTAAPVVATSLAEMQQGPARSASDAYVFAAVLCAVVGLVVPVVPAAAALMLTRATDDDLTGEALRPQLLGVKSFARGLAWFDLAWMTLLTAAFLLSTLGRVLG